VEAQLPSCQDPSGEECFYRCFGDKCCYSRMKDKQHTPCPRGAARSEGYSSTLSLTEPSPDED